MIPKTTIDAFSSIMNERAARRLSRCFRGVDKELLEFLIDASTSREMIHTPAKITRAQLPKAQALLFMRSLEAQYGFGLWDLTPDRWEWTLTPLFSRCLGAVLRDLRGDPPRERAL